METNALKEVKQITNLIAKCWDLNSKVPSVEDELEHIKENKRIFVNVVKTQ